ncbi:hypothetical protein EVAR_50760_1 [Eumeta japonica]|uniref:Uncharacterized protein n=1 Tax=Eumeta variegata TaxID=151549 RepID=A0A4C1Y163_EUMVA|nr:hypothetical protein EVAR_50760_1 [Eumeta japonica]
MFEKLLETVVLTDRDGDGHPKQCSNESHKGKTINSDLYCRQLMSQQEGEKKQSESINRKGVVFHHDKARPLTSLATRTYKLTTCRIHIVNLTYVKICPPPRKPALRIYPLLASENGFLAEGAEMMASVASQLLHSARASHMGAVVQL